MNVTQIATRNSGNSTAIIYLEGYILIIDYSYIDYLRNNNNNNNSNNSNNNVDYVLQCARDIKFCST
jgi:hypothetical protein